MWNEVLKATRVLRNTQSHEHTLAHIRAYAHESVPIHWKTWINLLLMMWDMKLFTRALLVSADTSPKLN